MNSKSFLAAASLVVFQLASTSPLMAADDQELLQGTWKVVSLEHEGEVAPPDVFKNTKWRFEKESVVITEPDVPDRNSTFKIVGAATPKQIDFTLPVPEPEAGDKKKPVAPKMLAIYELKDGKLKICYCDPTQAKSVRPKQFKTKPNSGVGLVLLERDTPK